MATSNDKNGDDGPVKSKADLLPELEPLDGDAADDASSRKDTDDIEAFQRDEPDSSEQLYGEEITEAELSDIDTATDNSIDAETELSDALDKTADGAHIDVSATDLEDTANENLAAAQTVEPDAVATETLEETAPVAAAAAPPPAKGGGFWGGMFGGLIAAAVGFGTSRYTTQDWPFGPGTEPVDYQALITEQAEKVDAQAETLSAHTETLTAQSALIETQASTVETIAGDLAVTSEQVTALTERFDNLAEINVGELPKDVQELIEGQRAQIGQLNEELAGVSQLAREEISALQAEMNTITELANSQIETAEQTKAEAERAEQEAQRAAERAAARGALNDISNALANGGSFADALPVIAPAAEVPEALSAVADEGVATTQTLQNVFPDAARNALSSSARAEAPEGLVGRLQVFAKDQLGARSLVPREGDDPDAVLSRAEAAVRTGDLPAAIELVGALPEVAQESFADWMAQAQARIDAQEALADLTEALGAD